MILTVDLASVVEQVKELGKQLNFTFREDDSKVKMPNKTFYLTTESVFNQVTKQMEKHGKPDDLKLFFIADEPLVISENGSRFQRSTIVRFQLKDNIVSYQPPTSEQTSSQS